MVFLAFELWPYLAAAAAIGLLTGWFAGCTPRRARHAVPPAGTPTEAGR